MSTHMRLADLQPTALYHLATAPEWDAYLAGGSIEPGSLEAEGFVHCSWGHQVTATIARHFSGATSVLALCLDPQRLGVRLVEEDLYGSGQLFPHAYGSIPVAAVLHAITVA